MNTRDSHLIEGLEFFVGHSVLGVEPLQLNLQIFEINLISVPDLLGWGHLRVEAVDAIFGFVDTSLKKGKRYTQILYRCSRNVVGETLLYVFSSRLHLGIANLISSQFVKGKKFLCRYYCCKKEIVIYIHVLFGRSKLTRVWRVELTILQQVDPSKCLKTSW